MLFDTPILFLVFNRPDTTARVFEKIKEIKPKQLFIAADGPRISKEGEKEKCDAVRKLILEGIDWPCNVETLFREKNLGCGKAVSEATLWFFGKVEEGIVLEDDTLPDITFFNFCKVLLKYYKNNNSIKMIGGNNFQNDRKANNCSYYFSNITHSWGYASWRRAWQDYDFKLKNINEEVFKELLRKKFSKKDERDYWTKVYENIRRDLYDTWDFQFLFTMWMNNGICIIPNKNLVTNIGFGNNATHSFSTNDPAANRVLGRIEIIMHPSTKEVLHKADRFFFKNYLKGRSVWERRFTKLISLLRKTK